MNSVDALESLSTQITSKLWNQIKHLSFEEFLETEDLFIYIINIIKSINGIDIDLMNFKIKYNYDDDAYEEDEDDYFKTVTNTLGDNSSIPIEKCNEAFNEIIFKPVKVTLNLRIKTVNIIHCYELACKLTFQCIKEQVKLLITKIKELRYNNYIGNFYDSKENEFVNYLDNQLIASSFYDLLKDNENITLNDLNCCVCIEPTLIKLIKCCHKICIKCIQQLKERICPLCRVNIDCGGEVGIVRD